MKIRAAIVILSAVFLTGCASLDGTSGRDISSYSESLREELAKKRFRARWWNYYERGVILMQYEQYDDAEADLRVAMSKRTRDTRWARTYGLHFLPEYFPNRELGISLFEKGAFDEAEGFLEQSYSQQQSARGAFYLNRVRERRIRNGDLDQSPPRIELRMTDLDTPTAALARRVVASITDDTYVRSIEINDRPLSMPVSVRRYDLDTEVPLRAGTNTVRIAVTDMAGRRTVQEVDIPTDHDGPGLSFRIAVNANRLSGYAVDSSGIDSLTLGGRRVALISNGNGQSAFEFVPSAGLSVDELEYVARDVLGNETRGIVAAGELTRAAVLLAAHRTTDTTTDFAAVSLRAANDDAVASEPLQLDFMNLVEGQRYVTDEIVVSLAVESRSPISLIELNGVSIPGIVQNQTTQRISRRIALDEVGDHVITVRVVDGAENTVERQVRIERRLPQALENAARLKVAMLGNLWSGESADLQPLVEFMSDELPASIRERDRFAVLDRDAMEAVLSEQELSTALSKPSERVRIGQIQEADYLLVGDVRRFGTNLEMILHALDANTGREVLVDVYGPGEDSVQIAELAESLSLRLVQEFPLIRRPVLSVSGRGNEVTAGFGSLDRVWESYPCIVFREVEVIDPATQQSLGTDWVPVHEGFVTRVRDDESSITLSPTNAGDPVSLTTRDYVMTK